MSPSAELESARPLHELLSLHASDDGAGEVRRLATLSIEGIEADQASILGKQVAQWDTAEVKARLRDAFDLDPFGLMFKAWSQLRKVHKAAKESAGPPPAARSVALAKHEIDLKVEPRLVLDVGGVDWCSVQLSLTFKLSFESVVLDLQGGELAGVKLGHPTGTVTLKCEGHEVADFKRDVKLHAAYRFNPPLPWPAAVAAHASRPDAAPGQVH